MKNRQIPARRPRRLGYQLSRGVTIAMMLSASAMAAPVSLWVRMNPQVVAAPIKAGTVVGQGRIQSRETHSGFRVWLANPAMADSPACYRVSGTQDSHHVVTVCLKGENWLPEKAAGQGMVHPGSDIQADFTLTVADDTVIAADSYALQVNGALMTP